MHFEWFLATRGQTHWWRRILHRYWYKTDVFYVFVGLYRNRSGKMSSVTLSRTSCVTLVFCSYLIWHPLWPIGEKRPTATWFAVTLYLNQSTWLVVLCFVEFACCGCPVFQKFALGKKTVSLIQVQGTGMPDGLDRMRLTHMIVQHEIYFHWWQQNHQGFFNFGLSLPYGIEILRKVSKQHDFNNSFLT